MKVLAACIAAWLGCAAITAGAMNASFRGDYPRLYQSRAWAVKQHARFIGFAVFTGPIGLGVVTFSSGFFYHGWTLTRQPLPCTEDPQIWCKT